jgi:hypothetical protein
MIIPPTEMPAPPPAPPRVRRITRVLTVLVGILILAVFALSLYQIYVINFGPDAGAFSFVVPDEGNLPPADARGAFLQLSAETTQYGTQLIGLLETETPGVISPEQAFHVKPDALVAVAIRQSAIADNADYRVYRVAADSYPMGQERLPSGTVLRVFPEDGHWLPGNYIVDIPANGTFGGREYYTFVVDEQ